MTTKSNGQEESGMSEPLSCDLATLSQVERKRRNELARYVLRGGGSVTELANGYQLGFKGTADTFLKIAEWIVLEKMCCPFLTFSLDFDQGDRPIRVTITGPRGTKEIMRATREQII